MPLQRKINAKIREIAKISHLLPCVSIIHDIRDVSPLWMCYRGLKQLGLTLSELKKMGAQQYYTRFFNEEDAKDINPKIIGLLERNNDEESVTFFQQVRVNLVEDWTWHISSTKILMRDMENMPILLFTQSMPIDNKHTMTQKASRLLEENDFLRKNCHQFAKLSEREIEVLKHLALGLSSQECGNTLHISPQTVDTHPKNIKKKLDANSFFELSQYAQSFDLI